MNLIWCPSYNLGIEAFKKQPFEDLVLKPQKSTLCQFSREDFENEGLKGHLESFLRFNIDIIPWSLETIGLRCGIDSNKTRRGISCQHLSGWDQDIENGIQLIAISRCTYKSISYVAQRNTGACDAYLKFSVPKFIDLLFASYDTMDILVPTRSQAISAAKCVHPVTQQISWKNI